MDNPLVLSGFPALERVSLVMQTRAGIPGRKPTLSHSHSTEPKGERGHIMTHAIDRFTPKFRVDAETGCWLWTASLTPAGYGKFFTHKVNGVPKLALAHRWSYQYYVGPIPEGLQLDHLCRVRSCINPDHLEPVTNKENNRRKPPEMIGLGGTGPWTHCKSGHPLEGDNVYVAPNNGRRACAKCRRRRSREAYVRAKAARSITVLAEARPGGAA